MIDLRDIAGRISAMVLAVVLAGGLAAAAAVAAEPRPDDCPAGHACPATGPAPAHAAASSGTPRPSVETPVREPTARNSKSLRWNIQNRTGRRLELQFYSTDRNWVWPNSNRVYLLPDSQRSSINISCRKNEKICYGAWLANNTRTFWGVGYRGRQNCRGCCYICGRGQTPLIKLVW